MRTDGQTDATCLIVAFQQFSGASTDLDSRLPAPCNLGFRSSGMLGV